MHYVRAIGTLLGLAGAFWLGRLSHTGDAGVPSRAPAVELPVQRELAELKRAIRGLHTVVEQQGERTVGGPLAAAAPLAEQCQACPAAFESEEEDPKEAAAEARAIGDPRFERGEAIVTDAIARGRWTAEDIERFRTLQREDPGAHWIPLMQQVDLAITQGKLQPDPSLTEWH